MMGILNEHLSLNLLACFFSIMILAGLLTACLFTGFWRRKSFYRTFFLLVIVLLVSTLLYIQTWLCIVRGDLKPQITYYYISELVSVLIFPCSCQFLFCLTEEGRHLPKFLPWLVLPISLLYLATEVVMMGLGVFSYNAKGILVISDSATAGTANVVVGVLYVYISIVLLFSAHALARTEIVILLISYLFPAVLAIQGIWNTTPVYVSQTFLLLLQYQIICRRRDKRMSEQDLDITERNLQLSESRIRLMVSQIQPHFLYNSLTAIANLCDTDPKKAREITLDFSQYLSQNLKFMQEREPVPFAQELDFVRLYTNIEKARFGERLRLEYSIGAEDFSIPTLTVQPLVENAIRHGVTVRPTGGTVRVTAEERADCFAVIVLDDGVGFNQGEVDWVGTGDHYGIENIRIRIREQMGGTLSVTSRPGGGTTCEITIPKEMKT